MTAQVLRGERVDLRPIDSADIDELHRIVSTPEVARWWNPHTRAQLEEIAKAKMKDLTAADLNAAVRTIAGSARSMGVSVEGV